MVAIRGRAAFPSRRKTLSWYQHRRHDCGATGCPVQQKPRPAHRHFRRFADSARCRPLPDGNSAAAGLVAPALLALLLALHAAPAATAEQVLWGYGVRGCDDYVAAAKAADGGAAGELGRFEDWLAGFISGLNLALGEDVLRGSGLNTAMNAAREYCTENSRQDFFNAAMDHVRNLASLR
jgi:hypothetical protein